MAGAFSYIEKIETKRLGRCLKLLLIILRGFVFDASENVSAWS